MAFQDLIATSQNHFPALKIKHKDQSPLMKFLAKLLFFDKDFMTGCTRVCNTIYIPRHSFIKLRPISSVVLLLHELARLHSSEKQACLSTLYVIWRLSQKLHFKAHLETETQKFVHELHKPWLRTSALEKQFKVAMEKIQNGERPYSDPIFDILDELIDKA
jgi:hypothetical protein